MTKKEFKEKIQAQKEATLKQHEMEDKRLFRSSVVACGIFSFLGVALFAAGAITGIYPLGYAGTAFITAAEVSPAIGYVKSAISDKKYKEKMKLLDELSDDDSLYNSEEISQ